MAGQRGLRLLSLDGAGIHSLSELFILQDIMKRVQSQENLEHTPKPCDYFDLIGGTSMGGITALMLGRLRMPVSDAIECYQALIKKVFSRRKTFGEGKFSASKLEEIIKGVVKEWAGDADERMMDMRSEGDGCKTFVCAIPTPHVSIGTTHLFRTYQARAPGIETYNCTIWEAARATSAEPTFFKRIEIGERGSTQAYVGGGMSYNIPIAQVLEEAATIFPEREVACVVSVGTSRARSLTIHPPKPRERLLPLPWRDSPAVKGITVDRVRSETVTAERFEEPSNFHFRIDVEKGLENIEPQQWEKLREVTTYTQQCVQDNESKLTAVVMAMCETGKVIATDHIIDRPERSVSVEQEGWLKKCPPPTDVFTGRQDILEKILGCFFNDPGNRHVFVLHGIEGVGKSQIAFKFVELCQTETAPSRFLSVFFVDASTAETIKADLISIAIAKGLGETIKDTLDWLAESHKEWLLVFDNADDTTFNLGDYFPECNHGKILITSREADMVRHSSGHDFNCQVSVMDSHDATSLLLNVAGLREEHTEEDIALAGKIVEELGHLTVAIVDAGAYISSTQCDLRRYLDMYQKCRDKLLEGSHDSYKGTVYTTWKIKFNKLSGEAAMFLKICAFLHHDGISETIFRNAAVNMTSYVSVLPVVGQELDCLEKAREFLRSFGTPEEPWDKDRFSKIISEIRSHSLIDFDEVDETYSLHPLVHKWIRTTIEECEEIRICVKIILGLSVSLKFESTDYIFRYKLIPHVDMVLQGSSEGGLCALFELGFVYREARRFKEAERLFVEVMEARVKELGREHPDTLIVIGRLGVTYWHQRRLSEAEELIVQVKEASERVLGKEHPDTLKRIANLSWTYWSQGRWKEAEALQVKVKEARERVLGKEHRDSLNSLVQLAATYQSQGRKKEAEELYVQAMETGVRVFGKEHPETLWTMSELADLYLSQERWKEAEELHVQVKEVSVRVLGRDHPNVLWSIESLAANYAGRGQLKEAEELYLRAREGNVREFGTEHSDTLSSMEKLSEMYRKQKRWKEAEKLDVNVMETRRRVLGGEHADTLASMTNLALTYWYQRRWKEAEELDVHVMGMRLRALGEEHPDSLLSMENLAWTYERQGRWEEAEKLCVQAKETKVKVLGGEHPATLSSMRHLASMYSNRGRWREAEVLYVQVKDTCLRVFGADHPETLSSLAGLASTYCSQERLQEAEALDVRVMEGRLSLYGEEHADTLSSMGYLAGTYWRQGRFNEAEELQVRVKAARVRLHGIEHPDTLCIMADLALTYKSQGRLSEVEELLVQVKEGRVKVLGEEHPDTLSTIASLTEMYWDQGRWKDADELEAQSRRQLKAVPH